MTITLSRHSRELIKSLNNQLTEANVLNAQQRDVIAKVKRERDELFKKLTHIKTFYTPEKIEEFKQIVFNLSEAENLVLDVGKKIREIRGMEFLRKDEK